MLKRDSLMAQMQQLSHILAKVKRLILENSEKAAEEELKHVLSYYYGLNDEELIGLSEDSFLENLKLQDFKSEELSLLAAFMDEQAGIKEDDQSRNLIWKKVILIYDLLEKEYHIISYEHMARRTLLMRAFQ